MSEIHPILLLSDEAFGWYFTGLTDGEGHFDLHLSKKSGTYRVRDQWQARFVLNMRDDEQCHMFAIMDRLGCGSINWRPGRTDRFCNPQVHFCVSPIAELANIIVPHFERFPLQFKKSRDYAIWKQGVAILAEVKVRQSYRKWTHLDHASLESLVHELKACRKYRSHPA